MQVVNTGKVEILGRVCELRRKGYTWKKAADKLNREKFRTRTGKRFAPNNLFKFVVNNTPEDELANNYRIYSRSAIPVANEEEVEAPTGAGMGVGKVMVSSSKQSAYLVKENEILKQRLNESIRNEVKLQATLSAFGLAG